MTVSMRVMSAGDGYKYLLRSIAAADGDRSLSTPLTRYYAEEGTPLSAESRKTSSFCGAAMWPPGQCAGSESCYVLYSWAWLTSV